jgi:hypothetical protein
MPFIVPAFGLTQSLILVGNLHWPIQTAHLLVGIGTMALVQVIEKRYRRLRRAAFEVAGASGTGISSHTITPL